MLREDRSSRRLADLVPGAADPLQCLGSPRRATRPGSPESTAPMSMPSSSDEVATMARSSPRFELVLDDHALLPRQRPVVRPDELLDPSTPVSGVNDAGHPLSDGELVQLRCEPFRGAAGVAEDDRRAVGQDARQDLGIDRSARSTLRESPNARAGHPCRRSLVAPAGRVADRSSTRDDDFDSPGSLRIPASTICTGRFAPARPFGAGRGIPAEELGDLLERPLRRRQADPLRRLRAVTSSRALEREQRGAHHA